MSNQIIDIADEIYSELGSPTDSSLPLIAFWLQRNIGLLNSLIQTGYTVTQTPTSIEISPELGEDEKAIYKAIYYIYYYNRLIQSNLGAASWDNVLEVGSDGATVRMVNKNEIAKTYLTMRKTNQDLLDALLRGYGLNRSGPLSVDGNDTFEAGPYYTNATTTRRCY